MQMAAGGGIPRLVRGGLGAFTSALASAARAAGVAIRTDAEVGRIDIRNGRVAGVTLSSGEHVQADTVVSNADPRRTLLGLIDPVALEPGFLARMRSYRCAGTVAKINLALRELPRFGATGSADAARLLAGCIHIGPTLEYLERAFDASKYGTFSPRPYLDVTIPSIADPALAPEGAHVMSINAQFAPYRLRGADWSTSGPDLADSGHRHSGGVRTEPEKSHSPPTKSSRPLDLESTYGLTGGHIFHGELSLDQTVHHATASRMGPLSDASRRALLVRRRDPSGIWRVRTVGNEREPRDSQGSRASVNGDQNLLRQV